MVILSSLTLYPRYGSDKRKMLPYLTESSARESLARTLLEQKHNESLGKDGTERADR